MTGDGGETSRPAQADAVLIFCHCPKTAGTSLFRAIREAVGARRSYLATRSRPDVAALRARGIRFVGGHVPYPHYLAQPGLGAARFVTTVRDPEQVMLSLFRHYHRRRHMSAAVSHFFDKELPEAGIAPGTPQAVSLFFRRVAPFEPYLPDNPQVRFAVDRISGPLGRDDLEQAKRNLAAMDVVGSTNRLAESLLLMAIRFGWPRLRYGRYNASRETGAATGLPDDVKALCALDRELVEWAERYLELSLEDARAECIGTGRTLPTVAFRSAPLRRMSLGWLQDWAATARMYTRDDWLWWIGAKTASLRGVGSNIFRFLAALAFSPRVGIWPRLAVIAGISYLFLPVDLIPDRIPLFGHLDEAGFLLSGFVSARLLMPPDIAPQAAVPPEDPTR